MTLVTGVPRLCRAAYVAPRRPDRSLHGAADAARPARTARWSSPPKTAVAVGETEGGKDGRLFLLGLGRITRMELRMKYDEVNCRMHMINDANIGLIWYIMMSVIETHWKKTGVY